MTPLCVLLPCFGLSSESSYFLFSPQLADHLTRHFKTLQVTEKEVLTYFIYMAKNYKSKLDQKSGPMGEGGSTGGNASSSRP